ncbi:PepSY domain-containing protein [Parendozoicomonas haliclonae]|uniref:PepSY domain-containing protein n=1 Tax=Parendozoicomonas haliclonae TaxID=1960125 RepID=A0A1X7AH90_9GAMM|nr:PepSY domain-containing protein [Parendozoicomonas haliclonae]SMA35182.1 hypothetical protein EHSB41UT_00501 [Parendozoicomonas haliclonae]
MGLGHDEVGEVYSRIKSLKRAAAIGITLSTLFSLPLQAADIQQPEAQQPIDLHQVVRILQDQGFHDIRSIEFNDSRQQYEVDARNQRGKKVDIELDANNGKILKVERD